MLINHQPNFDSVDSWEEIVNLQNNLSSLQDKLNDFYKTKGQLLFLEEIKKLFTKYPNLRKIQWYQYTPYFNDGSPCYPMVCYHDALLNDDVAYEGFEGDNDYISQEEDARIREDFCETMSEVTDELFIKIFRNDVSITINREEGDSLSLYLEDYDNHD